MPRTNADDVMNTFETTLDPDVVWDWIELATDKVDDVAAADPSLTASRLERIERLYAQGLLEAQDPRVTKDSVGDSSATYGNRPSYLQLAASLDPTGVIAEANRQMTDPRPDASFEALDDRNLED